jgi:branched-chain amino acid aminotransferase
MIDEIAELLSKGVVSEIFASGTAVIVSPVKNVSYNEKQYSLPINPEYKSGELTYEIFHEMLDIQ